MNLAGMWFSARQQVRARSKIPSFAGTLNHNDQSAFDLRVIPCETEQNYP